MYALYTLEQYDYCFSPFLVLSSYAFGDTGSARVGAGIPLQAGLPVPELAGVYVLGGLMDAGGGGGLVRAPSEMHKSASAIG